MLPAFTMDSNNQIEIALRLSELRDRFATAALIGLYAHPSEKPGADYIAELVFFQADAMLAKSETPKLLKELAAITQNETKP
jgi:hypothetical protein